MKEVKEWVIRGFDNETTEKIDSKLMENEYSYWFKFRTLNWYRIRRIKGVSPINEIKRALTELQIEAKVWQNNNEKSLSSNWIIESLGK